MMKRTSRIHGILLAWMMVTALQAFSQQERHFADSNCLASAPAVLLLAGERVRIDCDSAWIISKNRYRIYEKARNYLLKLDPGEQGKSIAEYEAALSRADRFALDMELKYRQLSAEMQAIQEQNRQLAESLQKDIETASGLVRRSDDALENLKQDIKSSRRKNKIQRWIFGGAGLLAGLAGGMIIMK